MGSGGWYFIPIIWFFGWNGELVKKNWLEALHIKRIELKVPSILYDYNLVFRFKVEKTVSFQIGMYGTKYL